VRLEKGPHGPGGIQRVPARHRAGEAVPLPNRPDVLAAFDGVKENVGLAAGVLQRAHRSCGGELTGAVAPIVPRQRVYPGRDGGKLYAEEPRLAAGVRHRVIGCAVKDDRRHLALGLAVVPGVKIGPGGHPYRGDALGEGAGQDERGASAVG